MVIVGRSDMLVGQGIDSEISLESTSLLFDWNFDENSRQTLIPS